MTEADVNFVGSIAISENILREARMLEHQKVLVVDINNGNRFETYIISTSIENTFCINGAAARLVHVSDKIIVMTFQCLNEDEAIIKKPKILYMNDENNIIHNVNT